MSFLFRQCLNVWVLFSLAWCSILLGGGRWFRRCAVTPTYPNCLPPLLCESLHAHRKYERTASPPHTASSWYFLKVVCNHWLLVYRIISVGMLQKHLWLAADQSSEIQFKSITSEPQWLPGIVTLAICFSRGSFSKQLLLTCCSFDLLVAFAVNVNVDSNAAIVLFFKVTACL